MIDTVICGDCLEVMKDMADNSVDLVLTDPPYGIGAAKMTMGSGQHDWEKDDWDTCVPPIEAFDEMRRVSRKQIIWGGNYFTEHLPPSPHWLVWNKRNPNLSFAEGELAWVSEGKLLRIFEYYSTKGGKVHPTQKPRPLMMWCVQNYSQEGDIVFDPYCGSGTTGMACVAMGRHFIGIEINPDYCRIAEKRIQEERDKYALFETAEGGGV